MSARRHRFTALPVAVLLSAATFAAPAPALAQIPDGMSPDQVQSILSAPISVPAGETMSVDVGVPVSGSYQGDGWNVVSSGTSVTVTAPANPGAQASVPMTAMGQSATITLVAEQGASSPVEAGSPEAGQTNGNAGSGAPADPGAPTAPGAPAGGESPADAGAPAAEGGTAGGDSAAEQQEGDSTDEADRADGADGQESTDGDAQEPEGEFIDLEATIEDNVLTAKLGLRQAASLASQFSNLSRDDVNVHYRDADGNYIQGIERDIDTAALSLTLTYPEGETPDNPFFIEAHRGDDIVATVRLTAPDAPITAQDQQQATQAAAVDSSNDSPVPMLAIAGVVALVGAGAAGFFFWRRRSAVNAANHA